MIQILKNKMELDVSIEAKKQKWRRRNSQKGFWTVWGQKN